MSELKIETAKIELKKGDTIFLKTIQLQGKVIDFYKGERTVLEVMLENDVLTYCFLEDVERIINK